MKKFLHETFSSLKIRNFRLYLIGQGISYSGTFIQALAQDWLVLKLTNSGLMLGIVSACQFLPMLILMPFGGVIADRFPKLRLFFTTQTISCVLSFLLGLLVLGGLIHVWMVFVFAVLLGLNNSVDYPTRQSFVFEMVGQDEIKNAVSLWTILISFTRIIGPAIAGVLIATVGLGQCFIINAISYIGVLLAFSMMRSSELHLTPVLQYSKGQIKEGFKYLMSSPILFNSLIMMAVIGTMTFEWQASMPLFAKFVLHGDAGTYAAITVATSIGMLFGGLFSARSKEKSQRMLVYSGFLLGVFTIISAYGRSLIFALISFAFVGIFMITFSNISNSIFQLNTESKMRGRVMSFWNMAFQGSTAIGAPIVGWVGQVYGAPWSLAVGGISAILISIYGFVVLKKE